MPNLVELTQLFFELWWPQTRQTHRRHAKNKLFGLNGPQNVNIHQNLEVDFLSKCNTFSILRIAEKVKTVHRVACNFILFLCVLEKWGGGGGCSEVNSCYFKNSFLSHLSHAIDFPWES